MNRLPFTKYASKALNEGREIAGYLGFKDVSSIFILLGLYGTDGSLASEVLKMHGVTRELIEEAVKEKSKMPKDRRRTVKDTPKTEYLLEIAGELAMKYGCDAIGSEHILMAMIKDGDNEAFRLLEDHKISCEGIYTDILVTAGIDFRSAKNEYNDAISYGGEEENQEAGMLEQYSTDLTEKAAAGKLDPMIGREAFNWGTPYSAEPIKQMYTYEGLLNMYLSHDISSEEFLAQRNVLETQNTDWFKLLTRRAFSHNHNLSVSGGTKIGRASCRERV